MAADSMGVRDMPTTAADMDIGRDMRMASMVMFTADTRAAMNTAVDTAVTMAVEATTEVVEATTGLVMAVVADADNPIVQS